MRVALALIFGVIMGVAAMSVYVQVAGGWYEYRTFSRVECDPDVSPFMRTSEVVPNQPNPCHYRRPRWKIGG